MLRGTRVKVEDAEGVKFVESSVIQCLKEGKQYKFLGVLETSRQEDQLAFKVASEEYLKRLSVIWSSPLSDYHRVSSGSFKPVCPACSELFNVDPAPASH